MEKAFSQREINPTEKKNRRDDMFQKPQKKKKEEPKKKEEIRPKPKDRQDALSWAMIAAIVFSIIGWIVVGFAVFVEEFHTTWGGFALLAVWVVLVTPITVSIGTFWKSDKTLRLAFGSFAGILVLGVILTLGSLWVEQFHTTWGGFALLAVWVVLVSPLMAMFAAWEWAKFINRMPPPVSEKRQPLDEEWFQLNEPPQEEELIP